MFTGPPLPHLWRGRGGFLARRVRPIYRALRKDVEEIDGRIAGTVRDKKNGEPLVGVNVAVKGTTLGASTDINGFYYILRVPPGTHDLQASIIGYTTMIVTDVVVASGRRNQVAFPLQPTTIDLETVTVEAEYFRRNADIPVSAQTLSYEEIRRSPGGLEDVVRAIAVLPGVVQVSAGRNDLIVRGGAASENLFVIDGLEVPNINHFGTQGATGGPLSFVNLDFVRDVTFSTGGFGVRYGDKLSSVLDIQLAEGRNDRLGGKLTISASQFGLNADGPIGDQGSFLFSARRSYLDFIFKDDPELGVNVRERADVGDVCRREGTGLLCRGGRRVHAQGGQGPRLRDATERQSAERKGAILVLPRQQAATAGRGSDLRPRARPGGPGHRADLDPARVAHGERCAGEQCKQG